MSWTSSLGRLAKFPGLLLDAIVYIYSHEEVFGLVLKVSVKTFLDVVEEFSIELCLILFGQLGASLLYISLSVDPRERPTSASSLHHNSPQLRIAFSRTYSQRNNYIYLVIILDPLVAEWRNFIVDTSDVPQDSLTITFF